MGNIYFKGRIIFNVIDKNNGEYNSTFVPAKNELVIIKELNNTYIEKLGDGVTTIENLATYSSNSNNGGSGSIFELPEGIEIEPYKIKVELLGWKDKENNIYERLTTKINSGNILIESESIESGYLKSINISAESGITLSGVSSDRIGSGELTIFSDGFSTGSIGSGKTVFMLPSSVSGESWTYETLATREWVDTIQLKGEGAPTTETVGKLGQFYTDTTSGTSYQCKSIVDDVYTWVLFVMAPKDVPKGVPQLVGYPSNSTTTKGYAFGSYATKGAAGSIAQYNTNGALMSVEPSDPREVTPKSYVDNKFNGANKAVSFVNYSSMIASLNELASTSYNVSQNVMIVTLKVPDLWISEITETSVPYTYVSDDDFVDELEANGFVQVGYFKLSALETQKVDLTEYVKQTQIAKQSGDYGLVKYGPSTNGIAVNSSTGVSQIYCARKSNLDQQIGSYTPIVASHLGYAVKQGLINPNLGNDLKANWTEDEKATARETLGISGLYLHKFSGTIPSGYSFEGWFYSTIKELIMDGALQVNGETNVQSIVGNVRYFLNGQEQNVQYLPSSILFESPEAEDSFIEIV